MTPFPFGEPSGKRNADDMGSPANQGYDYRDVLAAVTAAILAERERCAKIADDPTKWEVGFEGSLEPLEESTMLKIAKAIRKPVVREQAK